MVVKSTEELIDKAKNAIKKMLERSLEKGTQPSFYEMYYKGYADGYTDSKEEGFVIDNTWHYVELEGNPPTDDKCWCLIQADKYKATELGFYDEDNKRWYCEYWNASYEKVIAWHLLPIIED